MVIEIHHAAVNKAHLNKHRSRCAGAAGQQDREPIHSQRFRKLNFATEQQIKSSGGTVQPGDPAGPRRNLLRTGDGAWRWIDY
jgi:hypothetical protein